MIQKILKQFKENKFKFLLLAFIVSLSYGQAINFSLWQDDNALAFKLQHIEEQVGVFGPGATGLGAYRYIALPYIPLYSLFGLNLKVFYFTAIILYFLSSVAIFFFAKHITKSSLLALSSASIFASGFIGSDGFLRLFNTLQASYSIILGLVLFFLLFHFQKTQKITYLLVSYTMFFLTIETAYVRMQYLILPVLFFSLIYFSKKLKSLLYVLPFLIINWFVYLQSPDPRTELVGKFLSNLLAGKFEYLSGFFGSVGYLLIPTPFMNLLYSYLELITPNPTYQSFILNFGTSLFFLILTYLQFKKSKLFLIFSLVHIFWFLFIYTGYTNSSLLAHIPFYDRERNLVASFLGGSTLIFLCSFVVKLLNHQREVALKSIFLASWCASNILAYSIYLPFNPLDSQNRYLAHSFPPYTLLFTLVIFFFEQKIFNKTLLVVSFSTLFVFTNVYLSRTYQANFINEKTKPTNKFFKDLKSSLPVIKKGSLIYFDVADNPTAKQEFRDFFSVGSMPDSTAIAVRYEIDRYDFQMTSDYEEFKSLAKDTPREKIHTFFYDSGGLVNTTHNLTKSLDQDIVYKLPSELENYNLDIPSVGPIQFEILAKAELVEPEEISCPIPISYQEKELIFNYLSSKNDYYSNVKITTTSEEKYLRKKALIDLDSHSVWRGNRGFWLANSQEVVSIDLGQTKNINQLIWVNSYLNSTPTSYQIETSINNVYWILSKKINRENPFYNGQIVKDTFSPINTRFVRFVVNQTFDKDSPAISEFEVKETPYENINQDKAVALENNPYLCANTKEDKELANKFLNINGIKVWLKIKTDKSKNLQTAGPLKIIPNNALQKLKTVLPPGGTKLEGLKIETPYYLQIKPARIKLQRTDIYSADF